MIPVVQSWDTNDVKLRTYFENYGAVKEAFVSYARDGKPRGFGFVVFESSAVADRVVRNKHTIDRREVRCTLAGVYSCCIRSWMIISPRYPVIPMPRVGFSPVRVLMFVLGLLSSPAAGGRQTCNAAN